MSKNIFVGGSGRSGTTALLRAIGAHPQIHSIPLETRFLVDNDGLLDLFLCLTSHYSLSRARGAIFRFQALMQHLATPHTAPYEQHDFETLFGKQRYQPAIDELLETLNGYSFCGDDYPAAINKLPQSYRLGRQLEAILRKLTRRGPSPVPLAPQQPLLTQPQFFANAHDLYPILAKFVDQLFTGTAADHGKAIWCEKTPHSLLHCEFLLNLVPNSVMTHVYRDPRGIVNSMMQQPWAPDDLEANCEYVEDFYAAWQQHKTALPEALKARIIEFSLENLVANPTATLAPLWSLCEVSAPQQHPLLNADIAWQWKNTMAQSDYQFVSKRLASTINALGYTI